MKHDGKLLIGVDLGTTGVRSIAYDAELNEIGSQYYEYPLINLGQDRIEQNAGLWWELVQQSIRAAAASFGRAESCAVCLSTQGIAFLPVTGECLPIGNAISWLDCRAKEQAAQLLQHFGAQYIYRITGKRLNEVYVLPKLMWLRCHEPEVFQNTHAFALAHDYLTGRLTGRRMIDRTLASGTMLYDIHALTWSEPLLEAGGVSVARLPEVCQAGTPVGRMLESVSAALGLPTDTIVVNGAQDQKCAALGAGITSGQATLSLGTAAALSMLHGAPQTDREMRIPCFAGIEDNTWITEGVISTAAAALKWLRNTFFPDTGYDELCALAIQHTQDNLFFYPHLAGISSPQWHAGSSGCFIGITLDTKPADFVHAVLEGVAFQVRANLLAMDTLTSPVQTIRAFGGGAKSAQWCQIIANATGLLVEVPRSIETASLGAAMLAGVGAGVFPDFGTLSGYRVIRSTFVPDPTVFTHLEECYAKYREIESKLWEGTAS